MIRSLAPLALLLSASCSSPQPIDDQQIEDAEGAIQAFRDKAPKLEEFFENAYGYAVFPSVGKGGFVVGGAAGHGVVYERGQPIGTASISAVTIGAQVGGQSFREIIFFETQKELETFRSGRFAFRAGVSAVAIVAGKSIDSKYEDGVAVFTLPIGGLMAEASVGGQRFEFEPGIGVAPEYAEAAAEKDEGGPDK